MLVAQRRVEAEDVPDAAPARSGARRSRPCARTPIAPLQVGRIGRRLAPRRAEVNREQRRRAVQQLVPARVDLRRQVMPLRIVLVGPELGVVIEVPARELARRDAARNRVEQAEQRARRAACRRSKIVWCTTSCSSTVKLKTVKPWTNASGIQISGLSKWMSPQVASARMRELPRRDHECRTGDFW